MVHVDKLNIFSIGKKELATRRHSNPCHVTSYTNNLSPPCHIPSFPFLLFILGTQNFFGMLFVILLILANFITPAGISLFGINVTLYTPKKAILFLSKIEVLHYTKFQKRIIFCRSLNFGRNYRGRHGDGSPHSNAHI